MKALLSLMLLFCIDFASAEIYKWVDSDGVVHYSDEPQGNAKPLTLPEISIFEFRVPEAEQAPPKGSESVSETVVVDYRIFEISRPSNNDTFRGAPELDVGFNIDPELRPGHRIELSLDGVPLARPIRSKNTKVSGFSAGSHILAARILTADGRQIARSKSVLFHAQPAESGPAQSTTSSDRP